MTATLPTPTLPTVSPLPSSPAARVEYVVGFAFDVTGRVALIRKNRPAWQAGLLNGIGGHVEPGELPEDAMLREFHEETGVLVEGWEKFVVMDFPGARVHFYRRHHVDVTVMDALRTTTDEEVVVTTPAAAGEVIPNLTWLLPLAAYSADTYDLIHVTADVAEAVLSPNRAPAGAPA